MKTLNEEETSFNGSLNIPRNLIFELKKILPEKVNYMNNNYYKEPNIKKTGLNEFHGYNLISDNPTQEEYQGQIEGFESQLYFIKKNNISGSIQKEEDKLLNKKRKREKIFLSKKIANKNKLSHFGRKLKEDKGIRKHNSSSIDNIMNKIRTHFFQYIRDIIQKNSIYKSINLLKFRTKFVANLKKDENVDLLDTKIKDILINQPITTKNKKSSKYENRFIINKIYKEKKEKRVIQILELTFKELFIIYRRKLNKNEDKRELKKISKKIKELDLITNNEYDDTDYLKEDIRDKNSKNNKMTEKELEEYINKVLEACCDYETWFYKKISREKKKD